MNEVMVQAKVKAKTRASAKDGDVVFGRRADPLRDLEPAEPLLDHAIKDTLTPLALTAPLREPATAAEAPPEEEEPQVEEEPRAVEAAPVAQDVGTAASPSAPPSAPSGGAPGDGRGSSPALVSMSAQSGPVDEAEEDRQHSDPDHRPPVQEEDQDDPGKGDGLHASVAIPSRADPLRVLAKGDARPSAEAEAAVRHALASGGGEPLPAELAARFGDAFGHDFTEVRIHRGPAAAHAADAIGAHAFTVGSHIFFNAGEYSPGTAAGDKLLAHELTHVVQHDEGRAPTAAEGMEIATPGEASESEARDHETRIPARLDASPSAVPVATAPAPDAPASGGVAVHAKQMVGQDADTRVDPERAKSAAAATAVELQRELDAVWTEDSAVIEALKGYWSAVADMCGGEGVGILAGILADVFRETTGADLGERVRSTTSGTAEKEAVALLAGPKAKAGDVNVTDPPKDNLHKNTIASAEAGSGTKQQDPAASKAREQDERDAGKKVSTEKKSETDLWKDGGEASLFTVLEAENEEVLGGNLKGQTHIGHAAAAGQVTAGWDGEQAQLGAAGSLEANLVKMDYVLEWPTKHKLLGEEFTTSFYVKLSGSVGAQVKASLEANARLREPKPQGDGLPKLETAGIFEGTGLDYDPGSGTAKGKPGGSVAGQVDAFAGARISLGVGVAAKWMKKDSAAYVKELDQSIARLRSYLAVAVGDPYACLIEKTSNDTLAEVLLSVVFGSGGPGMAGVFTAEAALEGSAGIGGKARAELGLSGTQFVWSTSASATFGLGAGASAKVTFDMLEGIRLLLVILNDVPELVAPVVAYLGERASDIAVAAASLGDQFEDWLSADDEVREAVGRRMHELASPSQRARMLTALMDGVCGPEDEAAIVEIVEHSQGKGDLSAVVSAGGGGSLLYRLLTKVDDDPILAKRLANALGRK